VLELGSSGRLVAGKRRNPAIRPKRTAGRLWPEADCWNCATITRIREASCGGAMKNWKRIPDDQRLSLDRREHRFSFPGGSYAITWDPSLQHALTVDHDGSREEWSVELREVSDYEIRLSGMADWVPEILGEPCWFELLIGDQPSITYWGNQVIYRQDF
jgi:hypothetical protein